jgi:hypothetical protein
VNSQVPWLMHQPVQPCTQSSSRPEFCITKAVPAMEFRVASNLASFSTLGAVTWGFPRGYALPFAPVDEVASFPASCILRLCRRPSFELPRLSRPSAHPVVKLGSPRPSLFRLRLPMRSPGCPGFRIFRPCRRWIFESPRISHPSAHSAL